MYLSLLRPTASGAQDPSHHYFTFATPHFRVTFTRPLEPLARRIGADAERAYAQLSRELHPPRGTVDILVSDDADFSNGSATPYPSNRIVVYATPPVNETGLRFTTDWAQLVVTHELTHIFHLDRSRGVWQLAQHLFGRSPFLFPNLYSPSWLIEGLAVYEESKLAGEGRIEAPEHTMLARAAAASDAFPTIGQASLALPTFPFGIAAYAYGSLFVDYLAKTRGDSAVRRFVESSALQPIPYLVDIPARGAFGTTFTRAWTEWRRSVEDLLPATTRPIDGWRELTHDGVAVSSPRWRGDSSLTYTGTGGREAYGAFEITLDGRRKNIGRRNSGSPTIQLKDGGLLFSQLELTSPYAERSDLFIQRGERQYRLTRNARLFTPDARPDGAIVAAQIVLGTSRLVRVSADGATIDPITSSSFDTLWSEPRWSNRGDRITAVRWFRGGVSQIVVIDTMGRVQHVATSGRFTAASPSWIPGDSGIAYTVGDGARNDVYLQYFYDQFEARPVDSRGSFPGSSYKTLTYRVTPVAFGAFEPQLATHHTSGETLLAAVALSANGYRLGVVDAPGSGRLPREARAPMLDLSPDPRLPSLALDSSRAGEYSALRTLLPRYWAPLFQNGMEAGTYRAGGYTEGWDLLRRHHVYGELLIPTDNSGLSAAVDYQYKGLGLPILSLGASQTWETYRKIESAQRVFLGTVRRRVRDGELLATFVRQRVRNAFTLSAGAGVERWEFVSVPDSLLLGVTNADRYVTSDFPRVSLSTSYAAYRSPPFAISPEDGFTAAATVRERLRSGFTATGSPSTTVVGAASAYKSLDLPGFGHHVLAIRGSAGWSDTRAGGYLSVGGTNGGRFQLIPGYTVGEGRQTFPVRGFASGTLAGIRALSGSAEYRAPLSLAHRSIGLLPAFLNRSSVTVFGDYGTAWCPSTSTARMVCTDPGLEIATGIASLGAELNFNAGVLSWDAPNRFRLGVAVPAYNRAFASQSFSVYLTSGLSF